MQLTYADGRPPDVVEAEHIVVATGSVPIAIPGFEIEYEIDPVRQAIADSWPRHIDDSAARSEWGWAPAYDLAAMTKDMLENLESRLGA